MAVEIRFLPPAKLLNLNDRDHWAKRSANVKAWRQCARVMALAQVPAPRQQPPSVVAVTLPVRGNRRRDAGNLAATVKPIVDGLVDAGLWPDDDGRFVRTVEPTLHVGGELVVVTLAPFGPEAA